MAKGARGPKRDALHPLVLRADEVQEQKAFLSEIIAQIRAAGELEARRAREPFPSIHSAMFDLLLAGHMERFLEQYAPLFAALTRSPAMVLPGAVRGQLLEMPALGVPADVTEWFKPEVDAVLHSVGLASEAGLHPNRQYEELVAHMLLFPKLIDDANELGPWLPLGFGITRDGRTLPQVDEEADIRPSMREAAARIRRHLQRPWRQVGASPYGSSARSQQKKDRQRAAKLLAGQIAYELATKKRLMLWAIPNQNEFKPALAALEAAGVKSKLDATRGSKALAEAVRRLIDVFLAEHPELPGLPRGRPPGPRW